MAAAAGAGWRRMVAGLVLALAGGLPAVAAEPVAVDLQLVMALDGSASISAGAQEFQLRGHAQALRDPEVMRALSAGPRRATALTLVRYSGPGALTVLVPWTVIDGPGAAERFAAAILALPRRHGTGNTALGNAVDRAAALFAEAGTIGDRRRIDLVGNGFSNGGVDPAEARDRAVAAGITVSALAICDEFPWLGAYYQDRVIGGPGAFVIEVADAAGFADALRRKLILEVSALW